MQQLTDDDLVEFLDEREHLARIATVDDDGFPRVLPLWFVRDDRRLLFTPRSRAVIWRNIQRDPKLGITIDESDQPYRKVTVRGVRGRSPTRRGRPLARALPHDHRPIHRRLVPR